MFWLAHSMKIKELRSNDRTTDKLIPDNSLNLQRMGHCLRFINEVLAPSLKYTTQIKKTKTRLLLDSLRVTHD
jgi:hypothetical protein